MFGSRFLLSAWLCLLACVAMSAGLGAQVGHDAPGHPDPQATAGGRAQGEQGHAQAKSTLDMTASEIFDAQFEHSVPYVIARPQISADPAVNKWVEFWNVNKFQWIALVVMVVLFVPVVGSFRRPANNWLVRMLRGWCLWIRDEMVYSVMGKEEGRSFVPYFLFLFFFLAVQNSVGLLPSVGHVFAIYTATGTPYVTVAFALVTLGMMLFFGMKKNGVFGFWKGLIPHGLPVVLVPMMLVIELVSLVVKPFALTIRLFANMLAGHLVIASAIGLIFLFAKMQGGAISSYLTALPCAGMAIFIYIIEAFVTLLQAYIFTYLSIIFVHQAMHQDH